MRSDRLVTWRACADGSREYRQAAGAFAQGLMAVEIKHDGFRFMARRYGAGVRIIPWRQHVNGPVPYAARSRGHIAIMVWIVQLPFVALVINIGLIALAAWIVQGPFVALLAIIGFVAAILSALRWATTVDIRRHRTTTPDVGTALDVLNARYARGEIDQAEYREKRAVIASRTGGES